MSGFGQRLAQAVRTTGVPLAVGIDPHLHRLPRPLRARFADETGEQRRIAAARAVKEFSLTAVRALAGKVAMVKPQVAFFEQLGAPGFAALEALCAEAADLGLLVLADAKRGDISSTAAAYSRAYFGPDAPFPSAALTVSPYLGLDTLVPFLDQAVAHQGGLFVLVRTTNPGSAALQHHGSPRMAEVVAAGLAEAGTPHVGEAGLGPVGAVVGAFADEDARRLRSLLPHGWFLVPGVGAQGGTVDQALAGVRPDGLGVLPVASRSVLFPSGDDAAYDDDPGAHISRQADALAEVVRAGLDRRLG